MSVTLTDINIILVLNKYHRVNHESNKVLIIQKALYRISSHFHVEICVLYYTYHKWY
ncbi:hypothetical protein MtrunA17_Chr7g0232741 [Medicago truncatula]|nr:hypothetical protein MtrunA17_Chr7g0232741 [Medicago truncatula]